MNLGHKAFDSTDVGHVDGLVGEFYVQQKVEGGDRFDQAVASFRRGLSITRGHPLRGRILPPEEWIENPYYAGPWAGDFLWPEKKKVFIRMARGNITECLITGSLGVGKSQILVLLAMYQAYVISRFVSVHDFLGLPITTTFVGVFISLNKEKARTTLFNPFKTAIDNTPYFQRECQRDKTLDSSVVFRDFNLVYRPDVTAEAAIHGEAVLGIFLSEANFLDVIQDSARKRTGEALDVGEDVVVQGYRRMDTRFLRDGKLQFCKVVLDSSRQCPDDLVERRERVYLENLKNPKMAGLGASNYPTELSSLSQWDAKRGVKDNNGKLIYSGEEFPVEVGVGNRASRILELDEVEHAIGRVVWCAVEHRSAFELDVDGSLRDLAGVAVEGLRPLIPQTELISRCIRTIEGGYAPHQCKHPFTALMTTLRDAVEFLDTVLINPHTKQPWVRPDRMRAAHADPAVTGDAFGLGVGHIEDIVTVNRLTGGKLDMPCQACDPMGLPGLVAGTLPCSRCRRPATDGGPPVSTGYMKTMGRLVTCQSCQARKVVVCPACRGTARHGTPLDRPRVYMDLLLRIVPPKNGRIMFDDVEALLNRLRAGGFIIGVVTADGTQSEQFLQRQLACPGVLVAEALSVDKTKDPYYALRDAVTDTASDGKPRFSFYDYQPFFDELRRVEDKRDKVDHAPKLSKDICDTAAGVVASCEKQAVLRESLVAGSLQIRPFKKAKPDESADGET